MTRRRPSASRLKWGGLALLLAPLGFLGLFATGGVAGGDISGLSHAVLALPLVLLAAAAWRWPLQAGAVLAAMGLAIVVIYAIVAGSRFEIGTIAIVEAILAVPVVSGVLFVLAGVASNRSDDSRPA